MSLMINSGHSGHRGHSLFAFLMSLESDWELCTSDSEVYLHLWLWSSFASVMWSIYLYELPMMPIVNYLWWMWCLFECGTWLWPNLINWLFVAALPSVTLDKEDFCRVPGVKHSAKWTRGKNYVHSMTKMASLPSVCPMTLGKEAKFYGFWNGLCRVPILWHTAKGVTLPSAPSLTHGKKASFAECSEFDTRQMGQICRGPKLWHTTNRQALPSA